MGSPFPSHWSRASGGLKRSPWARPWLSASALLTRRPSSSQTPTPCKILSQGCNLRSGQLPWGRDQVRVCLRTQTGRLRRRTEPRQGQSRRVSLQGASDSASGTKPGLEASHRPWEDSANKTLVNGQHAAMGGPGAVGRLPRPELGEESSPDMGGCGAGRAPWLPPTSHDRTSAGPAHSGELGGAS